MSNKNLKVYKMQFITEVKRLYFNVKFPCQVKMTWKRSNESAETPLVPIQNGIVNFNQILRLNVSMYFDTSTSKFVEKKCLYSFLISTEKGQKSAGSVSIDLAQFFNKRIYEMEQAFTLQKCPVSGTKVQMKIHYEEDAVEAGYDSMSCISAINQLDLSTASLDLRDITPAKKEPSPVKRSESESQRSSKSNLSSSEKGTTVTKEEQYFQKLQLSDVVQSPAVQMQPSNGAKMGDSIRSINTLTTKINDLVNSKSKDIRFQLQNQRRKINQLEEQLTGQKIANERLQKQLQDERKRIGDLQRQYNDYKDGSEHKVEIERKRNIDLQQKIKGHQTIIEQLESKMNQSGESQTVYIQQLKANHATMESKLTTQIEQLRGNMVQEKKIKNELSSKVTELETMLDDLKAKYSLAVQKNSTLQNDMRQKENDIEQTRINLEKAYQNLVASLANLI